MVSRLPGYTVWGSLVVGQSFLAPHPLSPHCIVISVAVPLPPVWVLPEGKNQSDFTVCQTLAQSQCLVAFSGTSGPSDEAIALETPLPEGKGSHLHPLGALNRGEGTPFCTFSTKLSNPNLLLQNPLLGFGASEHTGKEEER